MMPEWKWPDARGWIGIGVFALSVMLLWMMKDTELRSDEFFQTIATVIISNGLMAVIAWAYAATKGGGELAERNATVVENVAKASADQALANSPDPGKPQEVIVANAPENPVPTEDKTTAAPDEDIPEYAR